jgi:hypothetical protein
MSWDIRDETQARYIEFVLTEWVPGMRRLGAELYEAWYTQAGRGPEIHVVFGVQDRPAAHALLADAAYARLHQQLLSYIEDFRYAIRE